MMFNLTKAGDGIEINQSNGESNFKKGQLQQLI